FYYALFSNGRGWLFMSLFPPQSWIMSAGSGIFITLVLGGIPRLLTSMYGGDNEELLLYGKKARARIENARHTGITVNEQPQVEFNVIFITENGQHINTTMKRIVQLIDLHTLQAEETDILYLPENPHRIALVHA
ncbi:MAG: hypothetical protein Q4C71_06345, partial [Microbacteriaceae bacterium]|nr:hypothetical protein [Microbacteriaceae bacterium]